MINKKLLAAIVIVIVVVAGSVAAWQLTSSDIRVNNQNRSSCAIPNTRRTRHGSCSQNGR